MTQMFRRGGSASGGASPVQCTPRRFSFRPCTSFTTLYPDGRLLLRHLPLKQHAPGPNDADEPEFGTCGKVRHIVNERIVGKNVRAV